MRPAATAGVAGVASATALVLLLLLGLPSCSPHDNGDDDVAAATPCTTIIEERRHVESQHRVVLVTIDGVRWQDVFEERGIGVSVSPEHVPYMSALLRGADTRIRGIALGNDDDDDVSATSPSSMCGIVYASGGPNVSLPGYIEIFTGRSSHCLDNTCARVHCSVLDEAALASGGNASVTSDDVASISSWEAIASAAGGTGIYFVSAGRAWPPVPPTAMSPEREERIARLTSIDEAARDASSAPGHGAYRPDAWTIAIAQEYFHAFAPSIFHVGLGDTDELAHTGDVAGYLTALRSADAFVNELVQATLLQKSDHPTTILVTSDHGRAANFRDHGPLYAESARSWLIAIHVDASGTDPTTRRIVGNATTTPCLARDVRLADIAPTMRALLGLPLSPANQLANAGSPIAEVLDLETEEAATP